MPKSRRQRIEKQGRHTKLEGRHGSSYTTHRRVNCNREPSNKSPTKDNLPSHQTKDNPHPTGQGQPPSHQEPKNVNTLTFLIPRDFHLTPSTKNLPSTPTIIKAFEGGFGRVDANVNEFDNPSPSQFVKHHEVIPNEVFRFGLMPLFLVENSIILFNPNSSKSNASEEVSNYKFIGKLLRKYFHKRVCIETGAKPAKFMHEERVAHLQALWA